MPGWQIGDESQVGLLASLAGADDSTGFDLGDLPDSIWILHPMYERIDRAAITQFRDDLPSAADRYERLHDEEGGLVAEIDYGNAGKAHANFAPAGWRRHPGPAYRRLLWHDYARRHNIPLVQPGRRPGGQGALQGSSDQRWSSVDGPDEGTLDVESWLALVEHLTAISPLGADTVCTVFYTPWVEPELPSVLRGRLGAAVDLVTDGIRDRSPQNMWPDDLDWIVYTDYDLWATKVSGSTTLVERLIADPTLEVDRLPGVRKTTT